MDIQNLRLVADQSDIDEWNQQWHLEGDHLDCKACGFSQFPQQARHPFTHKPGCTAVRAYPHFPWRDLTWIIEQIKRDLR